MAMDHAGWVAVCYAVGVFLAVAFAGYAVVFGVFWSRKHGKATTEDFITARGTQQVWRLGWSWFAGAVGAWVIVAPAQYASYTGIVGVAVYALATGLPIPLIALLGSRVREDVPRVLSLSDFIGWRFGPVAKTLVFLLMLFNMAIALLAEYTTIGSIFADFVGSVSWGIIVVVGLLTLAYTAYGGLAVSIATDQAQGAASALLAALLTAYVAATYRQPLPKPLPEGLGPCFAGWISIFTMGVSMTSSTMFSEAVWQRVWAAEGHGALLGGAAVGCGAIVAIVFLSGFGGWLAFVGGYASFEGNPNTYLMQILSPTPGHAVMVSSWVGVMVVLLAIVMNEGAVDSLQNGLAAAISGHFLKNRPLAWTRAAVVLLNVPLVAIGTLGLPVLSLFLVANLLTACAFVPLLCGLAPALRRHVSESAFLAGVAAGALGVTGLGVGVSWAPGDARGSFAAGANWAWFGNSYDWRPFAAAVGCSAAGMALWAAGAALFRGATGRRGPGVSGVLMRVPGMRWLTACPEWPDNERCEAREQAWRLPSGAGPAAAALGKDVDAAAMVAGSGSSKGAQLA